MNVTYQNGWASSGRLDVDDLIERLRALSRHEHSDYSIGDEAATALEAARKDAERYLWLKKSAFCGVWARGDGIALVVPRAARADIDSKIDAAMQRTSEGDHG